MTTTRARTTRSRQVAIAGALVLTALTGCSGPRTPLEVSVKQVGSDVVLGSPSASPSAFAPVAPPPRQNPTPLGFPTLQPPPPITVGPPPTAVPSPSALPSPQLCPAEDGRSAATHEATNNIVGPPPEAILTYRNKGFVEATEGGVTQRVAYPELTYRRIQSGRNTDGTFGFSVAETLGNDTTTSTYYVDPKAGLYFTGMVTQLADGSSDSFTPVDPRSLLILPLPVSPNVQWSSFGVDPITQTSMSFDGIVSGKARVNACGAPLDAWQVKIMNGRTTSPGKQLRFTAIYSVGTQFGGLFLQDELTLGCDPAVSVPCDDGRTITAQNVATTNVAPALASR